MKPVNFNFDINKYQQTNKTQKQTNPIKQQVQTDINKPVKVSCELLSAYNNVVSFKGNETTKKDKATDLVNTLNLIKFKKLKESFKEFNNPNNWNNFINNACQGYNQHEIEEILETIVLMGSSTCGKFAVLTNIAQKEEIKYNGDGNTQNCLVLKRALTPLEAKDIIINDVTPNADIERYIELRDTQYPSEFSINVIKYGIKNDDIPRFKKLLEQLKTQDEALTCLAFDFDKTEKVKDFIQRLKKDYSGNKLNLFEVALCTTQQLNEEQTERFFELKSKEISYIERNGSNETYTLSTQEAVLLAKAELTDDELKRYAELKNKPFVYTSVREHSPAKSLSTELIIAYIKDKQSDEEISQLAKFDFKNSDEYDDFKNILDFFGYKSINKTPEKLQETISYITKLQDKNGNNIFKNAQGQFNFDNFDIESLHLIAFQKLNPEQTRDYSEILANLSKIPNIDKLDIKYIAAPLAKLPNNTKSIFQNWDNKYCPSTNMLELIATMRPQLTSEQIQDYLNISQILEKRENPHNIDIESLALQIASLPDEIKNSYKDKEGILNFNSYSLNALNIIGRYGLDLSQFKDFSKITTSIKKQMPFLSNRAITPISVFIAKLPNEIKCNFQNTEGNFEFTKEDLIDFETIANYAPNSSIYRDYHSILSVLKNKFPNISDKKRREICINLAILSEQTKNSFKNAQGEFCFDNLSIKELETICTYELTLDEYKDFAQILPLLEKSENNKDIDITEVSSELAKLPTKSKDSYKNPKGEFCFDGLSLEELEIISDYNLSHPQFKDYSKILSALQKAGKDNPQYIVADIAKLEDEIKKSFKDATDAFEFDKLDSDALSTLSSYTPHQCANYLYLRNTLGIEVRKAIYIATNEDLMQRFRLVNPDIFWKGATGESKEIFEIFNSILSTKETNTNPLNRSDFDIDLPEECTFEAGNLTFSPNDLQQGFDVELGKMQDETPLLVIKNKNAKKESYIAYDGAIALFRELDVLTQEQTEKLKESLSSHAHFSIEEINALTEAARHLFIKIIENNGECIISKGINNIENAEPFTGKDLDTETTKNKFDSILQVLHSLGEINIENILRLMPKDAIIQIRPYATSSSSNPILYSISAEWEDKNGIAWQFRTHSDDLKHPNNEHNWIYRLGYSENGEDKFYDNNGIDINDRFKNGKDFPNETHIWLDKEPKISENKYKDYLISNPNFQTIIRNISISFNKIQHIKDIAKELGINDAGSRPYNEVSDEIIQKCQQNVGFYYKYKKVVDYILMEKGFPPLNKTT